MRLNRFFLDFQPEAKIVRILDKEIIHQIRNVLRLKEGNEVIIFNNNLKEALTKIVKIDKNFLDLEILEIKENLIEPKREVILNCAILKKENFELVVQKVVEIGIKEIVPLITERTVKINLNFERLEKIIKEASEQSGRGKLPLISKPIDFEKAIVLNRGNANLFFDVKGNKFIPSLLKDFNNKKIGLFIGPEGGWDEKELALAKNKGFKIVNLSPLTFRAETAAIIVCYLALNL